MNKLCYLSYGVGLMFATHLAVQASEPGNDTVRVAAVQCPSVMGETAGNLTRIVSLVRKAADGGAKIVVLPECAVQGYVDPPTWTSWSTDADDEFGKDVSKAAELVPGPSSKRLAELADDLNIYLCVGIVEAARDIARYYNSQLLFNPEGKMVAHHRKKALWMPGDSAWVTPGDRPIQVVDTEYGRLGLMICYDFHRLPPLLAEKGADIVLYSVGWYGSNEKQWFSKTFPRKAVIPHGFDIVVANWSAPNREDYWPGRGHSCIITRKGEVLDMAESVAGNAIVYGDLEIRKR